MNGSELIQKIEILLDQGLSDDQIVEKVMGEIDSTQLYNQDTKKISSIEIDIRKISKETRLKVFMRDNYTCCMCGCKGQAIGGVAPLEIDHKIPIKYGGVSTIDNLQTLCFSCNRHKHTKILNSKKIELTLNEVFC